MSHHFVFRIDKPLIMLIFNIKYVKYMSVIDP